MFRLFWKGLLIVSVFMSVPACANSQDLPEGLYAEFKTTKGTILVKLFYKKTPLTTVNFVGLAEGKMNTSMKKGPFYDGLTFHRVIPEFMIQGGDPDGNGTGGPGYRFADEIDPSLRFDTPGMLAMANSGPATNGSQFFITHVATKWLNGKHTIFGQVVQGQPIVDEIEQGDKIKEVKILRIGEEAKNFKADQAAFDALVSQAKEEAKLKSGKDKEKAASLYPQAKEFDNGVLYEVLNQGNGQAVGKGDTVSVHYTGKFLDGTVFDSSVERDEPFELQAGMGMVIPGWDFILTQMKVGEKGVVIIPPALAYGESGVGPIPPNTWLVFEIEILGIK